MQARMAPSAGLRRLWLLAAAVALMSALESASSTPALPTLTVTAPAPVVEGNSGTTPAIFTVQLSAASVSVPLVRSVGAPSSGVGPRGRVLGSRWGGPLMQCVGGACLLTRPCSLTCSQDSGRPSWGGVCGCLAAGAPGEHPHRGCWPTPRTTRRRPTRPSHWHGQTDTVTVNYATANNIATAGADYTLTSGTLTFAPGETTKNITVNVLGDTVMEGNEAFVINLSGPVNAALAGASVAAVILDDDVRGGCGVGGAARLAVPCPAALSRCWLFRAGSAAQPGEQQRH
jgi:hypothetical protein